MSDTRCPHCCAEYFRRRKLRTLDTWKLKFTCGSWLHPNGFTSQSDYCKALKAIRERDEAREQNAKLRDIAEMAVKNIREARNLSVIGDWREIDIIQERLRAELDQLKEGGK